MTSSALYYAVAAFNAALWLVLGVVLYLCPAIIHSAIVVFG